MLEAITTVITCLSPIIVAYFGYITTKQQKQTKEFIDLQTKFNSVNEENKRKEAEEQKKLIESIQKSVSDLQRQVGDMKNEMNIDNINKQLENIIEISHVNFEYSQSLSQVICAIGDCIDSSTVSEESAKAFKTQLDEHQKNEREFTNRIFKVAY